MSLKDEYFASMLSQIRRWDAEFGMFSEQRTQLTDGAQARFDKQCREMRADRDAAYRKLQEIRTASESTWRVMQSSVDTAWSGIKIGLDEAAARLKKGLLTDRAAAPSIAGTHE